MTTSLPHAVYPIEWEGDGPSQFGAAPSDALYGEQEMVVVDVSIQPVRVWRSPDLPMFLDTADLVMTAQTNDYDSTVLQAPAIAKNPGGDTSAYQDTLAGVPGSTYEDVTLGAPDLALGGN